MGKDLVNRVRNASSLMRGLQRLTPSYWGMLVAHLGFAACIMGVVVVSQFAVEKDLKMAPGETAEVAGYTFEFLELARVRGPNFIADEARVRVSKGSFSVDLAPQKRRYLASGQVMTEASIDAGIMRDLFVAMGEPIGPDGAWAIRLHYKPMVRWMWIGAVMMAIGAFATVLDKRYRVRRRAVKADAAVGAVHGL